LRVCAIVKSDGVACNEDACYHDTTGHLSAVLASITKIQIRLLPILSLMPSLHFDSRCEEQITGCALYSIVLPKLTRSEHRADECE